MKRNYIKLKTFTFIIISILIMFNSCAVSKYDYYYATLKPDKSEFFIEKKNTCNEYYVINNNDSIHLRIDFFSKSLEFAIRNTMPVFLDYAESHININGISERIKYKNLKDTLDFKRKLFSEFMGYIDIGYTDNHISDYIDLYKNYDDNQYVSYVPDIRNVRINKYETGDACVIDSSEYKTLCHLNILSKEFTREDTPLKIGMKIVYYTDSLFLDRKTINLNFYQAGLMKIKDMRYKENRARRIYHLGERIGGSINDVTFYTKVQNGTIRGWPEIRYNLGWTISILFSPVVFPIYYLSIHNEETNFPFPLFQ